MAKWNSIEESFIKICMKKIIEKYDRLKEKESTKSP